MCVLRFGVVFSSFPCAVLSVQVCGVLCWLSGLSAPRRYSLHLLVVNGGGGTGTQNGPPPPQQPQLSNAPFSQLAKIDLSWLGLSSPVWCSLRLVVVSPLFQCAVKEYERERTLTAAPELRTLKLQTLNAIIRAIMPDVSPHSVSTDDHQAHIPDKMENTSPLARKVLFDKLVRRLGADEGADCVEFYVGLCVAARDELVADLISHRDAPDQGLNEHGRNGQEWNAQDWREQEWNGQEVYGQERNGHGANEENDWIGQDWAMSVEQSKGAQASAGEVKPKVEDVNLHGYHERPSYEMDFCPEEIAAMQHFVYQLKMEELGLVRRARSI